MPTIVNTSTAATATAHPNQRKVDRTSNSVLWAAYCPDNTYVRFAYSTDNGATWAESSSITTTSSNNYVMSASIFIDQDDYMHVVYKHPQSGYIIYQRGTPNAGRTTWAWSAATTVGGNGIHYDPDIVAHREGTGWAAHIVFGPEGSQTSKTYYNRVTINSAGVITVNGLSVISDTLGVANVNKSWPSIDFNHTGDGKTVAGSVPHLYVGWSAGTTGAGYGIRFKKATYSAGAWTWGTEREIDSTRFVDAISSRWLNCLFDGTRVMLVGSFTGADVDIAIYERDVADTATIARATKPNSTGSDRFFYGSATFDGVGNLYIFGQGPYSGSPQRLGYQKWTRADGTLSATSIVDNSVPDASTRGLYISAKRGYSSNRIEFVYTDGTTSPYEVKYSYIGAPPESTVTTATAVDAAAYSNQRKLDRTSNGVLWTFFWDGGTGVTPRYSTDNGATWSTATSFPWMGANTGSAYNMSHFIDQDDYAHVAYKDRHDSFTYYRRGTPNAGRTDWVWSSALLVGYNDAGQHMQSNHPDIVAHREGSGWVVHIVMDRYDAGTNWLYALYARINITSAGVITNQDTTQWTHVLAAQNVSGRAYPSIDFNHTGDGKTVAGGTPHLYVAWSMAATGAGRGIRFKKATYSAGAWTWGTEQEIDSTRYVSASDRWLNCLFDGTRVIMPGYLYDGTNHDLLLYERDVADTTTTTRLLVDNAASPSDNAIFVGSASYDQTGNVYLFGIRGNETPQKVHYRKWTRSTASLGVAVMIDSDIGSSLGYLSVKRGYSNARIEYIYTQGSANPYTISYGALALDMRPSAPTAVTVDTPVMTGTPMNVSWLHNDPNGDPQSKYQLRWRKVI